MQILIDLILVIALAAIIARYWKAGFFKSVLSAGRLVLTIILTVALGPSVSAWIDSKFINPPVFEKVHAKLAELGAQASGSAQSFFDALRDKFGSFIGEDKLQNGASSAQASVDSMVEQYSTSIAGKISFVISTIIGYVLLFIVCFLVLTLVIWLLGKIVKLPVIKTCDKILGLILGVILGFFAVCLLATLVYGILYATGDLTIYEKSFVLKFFYNLNVFQFILNKIF